MSKKYYIYQETTKWDTESAPNHVYVFLEVPKLRTAKCMGYIQAGTKELFRFKTPYTLDLKGRTFAPLS